MKIEKHQEALKETIDEISQALEDKEGLLKHQRRLAFMISLGISELIEIYFHKLKVIKEGSRIKHEWFKKKDIKKILSQQIVSPIDDIKNINKILILCKELEDKRNDIAYSSPLADEDILREEINLFFEVKKLIEEVIGGV
ncbi:hypothetical protein HZA96_00265 [Candidatus Woesearchaeota archaeon]|nr:hypothetical protein [Candidatus Woesearchaeota archaeon]